jgi:hypothetical protein
MFALSFLQPPLPSSAKKKITSSGYPWVDSLNEVNQLAMYFLAQFFFLVADVIAFVRSYPSRSGKLRVALQMYGCFLTNETQRNKEKKKKRDKVKRTEVKKMRFGLCAKDVMILYCFWLYCFCSRPCLSVVLFVILFLMTMVLMTNTIDYRLFRYKDLISSCCCF